MTDITLLVLHNNTWNHLTVWKKSLSLFKNVFTNFRTNWALWYPVRQKGIKLDGFRSQLQASYVSSHTEELWYNETVCLWMTIYTPPHGGCAL